MGGGNPFLSVKGFLSILILVADADLEPLASNSAVDDFWFPWIG